MVDRLYSGLQAGRLIDINQQKKNTNNSENVGSGDSFKNLLMKSINEVNEMQNEAEQATTDLMTGKTDNQAEVFNAVKKAGVAFDALMQIRNELMSAYDEVKQMRV